MSASVFDRYAQPAIETRMAWRGKTIYDALLGGAESAHELQVAAIWCDSRHGRLVSVACDFVGWTREERCYPDDDLATYICGPQDARERLVDAYQRARVEAELAAGFFNN